MSTNVTSDSVRIRLAKDDATVTVAEKTAFHILVAISICHLMNDATQSLLVPSYPLFRDAFSLNYTQIGLITLTYQLTASLLQPVVGYVADRKSMPYTLPAGMLFTLLGLVIVSMAPTYGWLIFGAMMLGTGSSVFHPESSRMARMASGGRFGLAQSIFQVGGNAGSSAGPLLAAAFIIPYGQRSLSWFVVFPITAIIILLPVSRWASTRLRRSKAAAAARDSLVPKKVVVKTLVVLLLLIFSKYFYLSSITSYFIFYLTGKFAITVESAQTYLFAFLFAMALGTLLGGPIGDRIGRKYVIWVSILGVAPFTLAMPHLGLFWTGIFVFIIGFILASAFAAIVVFAQELLPGRVGLVAGLFFGLSFGMAGVGAAVFGRVADAYGIDFVYSLCAYLPLLGCVAAFLPNLQEYEKRAHSMPKAD